MYPDVLAMYRSYLGIRQHSPGTIIQGTRMRSLIAECSMDVDGLITPTAKDVIAGRKNVLVQHVNVIL